MKSIFIKFVPLLLLGILSCKNNPDPEDKSIVPAETRSTIEYNQKQLDTVPKNKESSSVFIGNGNEPFWSIQITSDSLRFETPEKKTLATITSTEASGNNTSVLGSMEGGGNIKVLLKNENCVDGMSGKAHSHAVEVEIKENGDKTSKTFKGCGSYE